MDDNGFPSPEDAALSTWGDTPAANARVIGINVRDDRAEVVIETDPEHRDWVYCVRRGAHRFETVSGNGPTTRWFDPDHIQWD